MPSAQSVDVINSKLSFDTVLPVTFVSEETRQANASRYKHYEIIDGKNPLDEVDVNHPPPPANSNQFSFSVGLSASLQKEEHDPHHDTGSLGSGRRPCRPGWAAQMMSPSTPYRRALLSDLQRRTRYVLDGKDYEWCEHNQMDPRDCGALFTILEWRYVTHALSASSASDETNGGCSTTSEASPMRNVCGRGRSRSTPAARSSSSEVASSGSPSGVGSGSSGLSCAVCCKPGQRLPPFFYCKRKERGNSHGSRVPTEETSTVKAKKYMMRENGENHGRPGDVEEEEVNISPYGFSCTGCGVWAHTHCWGLTKVPALSPGGWECDACFLLNLHKRRSTLRCVKCNRSGGVMIPYVSTGICLSSPASTSEIHDSLMETPSAHHGSGKMGRAHPPASSTPSIVTTTTTTAAAAIAQNQQHLPPGTDGMCHVVCALAFSDTALYAPRTVIQPNGVVDRTCRPYAYALSANASSNGGVSSPTAAAAAMSAGGGGGGAVATRRYNTKQRAQLCLFCQHEVGCVRCSYPRCFETMHPSCAAEQQVIECFSTSLHRSIKKEQDMVSVEEKEGFSSSRIKLEDASNTDETTLSSTPPPPLPLVVTHQMTEGIYWHSCHTYCRQHFNFASRGMAGWRQLAEEAEEFAVKADLAELLRRAREDEEKADDQRNHQRKHQEEPMSPSLPEELVPAPIPKKRPRGRPPIAIIQQRKAYKQLSEIITLYWQQKRRQRRSESGEQVLAINHRLQPVVSAALRPEIIKISADTVRLSHFLSLVPEWQLWLVRAVEHELPIPDEEYADVHTYRKEVATSSGYSSRRGASGGGKGQGDPDETAIEAAHRQAIQQMTGKLKEVTTAMQMQAELRHEQVELDVAILEQKCQWSD